MSPDTHYCKILLNNSAALPYGVTLEQVYVDFLRYLFDNTKQFFEKAVLGGRSRWGTLVPTMKVILAHPNGWGTPEQGFLCRAARRTGIVSHDSQISFITEAEASVYFCLSRPNLNLASRVKREDKIVVCDAGGSTVDTTLYSVTQKRLLRLEEVKPSACVQAGGIFVDKNARSFFEERFAQVDSLSSSERTQYVNDGVEDFINKAKNDFDDTDYEVIVRVGGPKEDFDEIEVDSGDMTISSHSMASFFDPCVDQIAESLAKQISNEDIQYMFLVGGFGDSPYLFKRLNSEFGNSLVTLNDKTAKAVADGCVIWQIEKSVVSRVTRFSYGTDILPKYDRNLRQHNGRKTSVYHDGTLRVSDGWSEIVKQGTAMKNDEEIKSNYTCAYSTNYPNSMDYTTHVYATESASSGDFIKDNHGYLNHGFYDVCTLTADLKSLRGAMEPKTGLNGTYWQISFSVGIRFGGTQLEAFIEWEENGGTRRGPMSKIAAERQ